MIIPVIFPSAVFFWLNNNPHLGQGSFPSENTRRISLPEAYRFRLSNADAELVSSEIGCPLPLTVLSPFASSRTHNQNVRSFTRPSHFPEHCFLDTSVIVNADSAQQANLLVASPELCFLQAASRLDFHQLVIFGCELCGIYVYDEGSMFKQKSRNQITTANKIKQFLKTTSCNTGHRKALQAAAYLIDRANSKVEVFLSVLSVLPAFYGGYALKHPALNAMINYSQEAKELVKNRTYYYDMVWEEEKVVVEYDSDLTHLSSEQHMIDKHKATAATLSGYKIIHITKADIESLTSLDNMFASIRKALGMRPIDAKLAEYIQKRRKLIRTFWTFDSRNEITYARRCKHHHPDQSCF